MFCSLDNSYVPNSYCASVPLIKQPLIFDEMHIIQSLLIILATSKSYFPSDNCITFMFSHPQIKRKSRSSVQIQGAIIVTWSRFQNENTKFWRNLSTPPLSDAFFIVRVKWCMFLYVRKQNTTLMKISGPNTHKLVAQQTGAEDLCIPPFHNKIK